MASSAQKGSVLLFATVQQNPHLQSVQRGERWDGGGMEETNLFPFSARKTKTKVKKTQPAS